MRRHTLGILAALTLTAAAAAQPTQLPSYSRPQTSPGYRPAVSPYLNLSRFGAGGYFNITRPQREAFRDIGQLQAGVQNLQQMQGDTGSLGGLPAAQSTTGHPVGFFNYGQYYTFPFPRYGPNTGSFGAASNRGPSSGTGGPNQVGAPPGGQQNRGRSGGGFGSGGGIGFGVGVR